MKNIVSIIILVAIVIIAWVLVSGVLLPIVRFLTRAVLTVIVAFAIYFIIFKNKGNKK